MYRFCLYLSAALVVILSASLANAQTGVCTGYPLMYNGKPCASTTRYWDGQMGACGCGTGDTDPFSWQWTKPTAAASAPIYGSGTWCGSGCGKCYQLTPTAIGASPLGTGAPSLTPLVVKITNLCPYTGNEGWCAYDVNSYGYDAHFDLMDYNMAGLITSMGWNNPEVTYEEVDCATNGYTDWDCECAANTTVPATTAPTATVPAATKAPTTAPAKAATSAPTKAATTAKAATSAPTKAATSAPTKAATSAPTKAATSAPTKAATSAPTTAKAATSAPATSKAATSAPATAKAATPAPVATVAPTTVKATTPASSTATGNVQVQVNSGSNNWWIGVSLVNPAISAISSVQVKDASSTTWSTMTLQGNDYWNLYSFGPTQALVVPLSLRFTGTDGNVVTATNIITSFQAATVDTGVVV